MRALLAFFTVLPVSAPGASLQDAARKAYLLPLVGLLAGLPGAALLLLAFVAPPASPPPSRSGPSSSRLACTTPTA